jgi:hypothetical protein
VNEDNNNNNKNNSLIYNIKNSKPVIVVNDSTLQLSESSSSSSSSIDIADTVNKKDERLELVQISKGLIEMLKNAGFTIESILDNGPSHIAETLGMMSM